MRHRHADPHGRRIPQALGLLAEEGSTPHEEAKTRRKSANGWKTSIRPSPKRLEQQDWRDSLSATKRGLALTSSPGRGYAPIGETPEIEVASHPCQMNVISTITNDGHMRFMTVPAER